MPPAPPPTRSASTTVRPPPGLAVLFFVVIGFWVVVPFVMFGRLGQDALPFGVAGDLARDHPADVYTLDGNLFEPPPRFYQEACDRAPAGTDCADVTVSFVSPPIVLPLVLPLARLSGDAGVLVLRLIAGLSLAGGMAILWRRLTPVRPGVARYLVAVAVLLTPFAMVPLSLGQNAPLMFLSACLGTDEGDRTRRALAIAAVLSLTVAFKFSPVILVGVLVWQRRWKAVAATAAILGGLGGLTLLVIPHSLIGDFLTATRALPATALDNPYNGAVDAALHSLWPPLVGSTAGSLVSTAVRVVVAAGLFWWVGRRADDDTQWAYAWVLLMLFLPVVWWHYLLVAVPAVAYAWRASVRDGRGSERSFLVVVGVVAVTVLISIPYTQGTRLPIAQALFLLGAVALVPLVLRGSGAARASLRQNENVL
jgi:hypothetical protein